MSESSTATSSGGVGFFGLLGILFIGLKLGGVITWSWWLVLLPLYGPIAVALVILLGILGVFAAIWLGTVAGVSAGLRTHGKRK